jgi:predicted nucleotidyltransferase
MNNQLEKSILQTLAFFAAQDQALTLTEIWKYLIRIDPGQKGVNLSQISTVLESFIERGKVVGQSGLFFLASQPETLQSRLEKYTVSMHLLKKAARWASGLRFVPFVRAVAISGSSAQLNARPFSDIDLLIITKKNRIYLARFLVSVYFQIFGGRRYGRNIVERFCLNHYIVEGLALSDDRNLYTAIEYASLIPVFGEEEIRLFWKRNLFWIKDYLVHPSLPHSVSFSHASASRTLIQSFQEIILFPLSAFLETFSRFLQLKRIKSGQYVLANDEELSFHPESKGQRILSRFRQIADNLG